jgi:hypothetical protein
VGQYALQLPPELHKRALARAQSEDRSLAQVVRAFVREYVGDDEPSPGTKHAKPSTKERA